MAEWWPILFSVSQVAQVACLISLSCRMGRSMALAPSSFEHIVCKPGDVVCIAIPEHLSKAALEKVSAAAIRFEEETSAKLHVFSGGIRIIGAIE